MKWDINKQDQILSTIGLKRIMIGHTASFFDERKFKHYITSEYKASTRKETDEAYGMFEFNFLHIDSGLRLTFTSCESYDGETVEYKVIRMFIITSFGKGLEVMDADFKNKIFYTTDLEIPFAETNSLVE